MKFVDNIPSKSRTSGVALEIQDMIDVLKTKPGTPALVYDVDDNLSPQTASNRAAAFRALGVEAVSRTVDGKGTVYAVYSA